MVNTICAVFTGFTTQLVSGMGWRSHRPSPNTAACSANTLVELLLHTIAAQALLSNNQVTCREMWLRKWFAPYRRDKCNWEPGKWWRLRYNAGWQHLLPIDFGGNENLWLKVTHCPQEIQCTSHSLYAPVPYTAGVRKREKNNCLHKCDTCFICKSLLNMWNCNCGCGVQRVHTFSEMKTWPSVSY